MAEFATNYAPINYAAMQPQYNLGQTIGQGLELGDQIQTRRLEHDKQALALQQAQDYQKSSAELAGNPDATAQDWANHWLKFPQFGEQIKGVWNAIDANHQKTLLQAYIPANYALQSGNTDLAIKSLQENADALRNSGQTKLADQEEAFIKTIQLDPQNAKSIGNATLSLIDPKFIENFGKINDEQRKQELQPSEVKKANAVATQEQVKANHAAPLADAELTTKQATASTAQPMADATLSKAQADATTAGVTAENAPQKQQLDMQSTQSDINSKNALASVNNQKVDLQAQKDADNGLVNLGLPQPKKLPWADFKDAKQKAMLQGRIYSASEKALSDEREKVNQLRDVSQDAGRFLELNKQVETGGALDRVGAGQWVASLGNDGYNEMRALTAKLVPLMRVAGSGSTSDFDAKMFERGTIGVDKPPSTNTSIANAMLARAKQADDYLSFKQEYLQQNGTLQGADQYWKEYANKNPIFDPSKPNTYSLNPKRQGYQEYFGGSQLTEPAKAASTLQASPKLLAKAKQLGWSDEQLQQFLREHQ